MNGALVLASWDQWLGRAVFALVFLMLLVGLVLLPRRMVGQEKGIPPWWRNVRVWAIAVTLVQILVYLYWG